MAERLHAPKVCCSALGAALAADDFEPTLTIDDDGVLCLTIGITDIDEDEPTLVLEPMIYCPFCGTRLQGGSNADPASGMAGNGSPV